MNESDIMAENGVLKRLYEQEPVKDYWRNFGSNSLSIAWNEGVKKNFDWNKVPGNTFSKRSRDSNS